MPEDYRSAPRYRIAKAKSDLDIAFMHVASYTDDATLREARVLVRTACYALIHELTVATQETVPTDPTDRGPGDPDAHGYPGDNQ